MGIIKFSIKCALAGGTLYYLSEEGVWRNSVHTEKVFGKIVDNASPYVKQATAQLPIQIPDLPSSDKISYLTKNYWNQAIMGTFAFLRDLPDHTSHYTQMGYDMAVNNENMKSFFGSLGAPPAPQEVPKSESK